MNKTKVAADRIRRANRRHGHHANGLDGNGARNNPRRLRGEAKNGRAQRDGLDPVIQRYVDLYELAPIAYVAFDRSGRIQDFNLAGSKLLNRTREHLMGSPFSLWVLRADLDLFLRHLARCRADEPRVDTNLRLKKYNGGQLSVILSSTPTTSLVRDGARLFQTAVIDLTDRERAEEAIRRSEERYRSLFELVSVAVYACNADGVIQEYNRRAVELWGCEPGRNGAAQRFCGSYKIYYPDGRFMPHEECPMARLLRGERLEAKDLEIIVERPDGKRRHVIPSPQLLKDEHGNIAGSINCLYDITERKTAETARLRLAAIVQSSHDAIVAKNLDGIITDWNESAERIFGYKPKEIIGKSILTLIPKDRKDEENEILRKIRRGESIEHYQTLRQRKDGSLLDVSLTISPIKDAKGKIIGVSKIARDITKLKQTESRLAEQARLLDLSNDAILVRGPDDRIIYWNHGAEAIYGYNKEQAIGKISHDLLQTEHPEPIKSIRKKLKRNGRWSGELIHTRKDGTQITVASRWSLDRDERGRPTAVLETNNDISLRKKAERELRKSKQLLELLVQKRTKALRSANAELENEIARRKGLEGQILEISDREQERLGQELHDGLCQRLTAIAFMAQATALRLKNHHVADPTELEKIAQLINSSVTDARNIARDLHKEEIDAAGFREALHDLAERKIWKTPCRLKLEGDITIDDDRTACELFRILREGVINANKHARATDICLEGCRRKREIIFSVTDNGTGIKARQRNSGGGLGFHIMQYRAKSIGARLEVESPRRGGTRLTIYLPVEK